jgi:hypothetical protein
VNKGFEGFKALLKRLLDQSKEMGELNPDVATDTMAETLFSSMVGSSVIFGVDKSTERLDKSINALINYVEQNRLAVVADLMTRIP